MNFKNFNFNSWKYNRNSHARSKFSHHTRFTMSSTLKNALHKYFRQSNKLKCERKWEFSDDVSSEWARKALRRENVHAAVIPVFLVIVLNANDVGCARCSKFSRAISNAYTSKWNYLKLILVLNLCSESYKNCASRVQRKVNAETNADSSETY